MKKEFPLKALVLIAGAILLVIGAFNIISTNMTGNAVTAAPNSARCVDTDGGLALDLPGRCLQYSGGRGKITSMSEDKCLSTGTIAEYYCSNPSVLSNPTCVGLVTKCANGCTVTQDGSVCR